MKYLFLSLLTCTYTTVTAQNWQQVGDFNWSGPQVMYNDSVTGLLFLGSQSLLNGTDTVNGICTFDGINFVSLAKYRYDCGNVNCDPALFLTRYGNDIYYSGGNLQKLDTVEVHGIGRWDGTKWSAGLPGLAIENYYHPFLDGDFKYNGKMYASGVFRTAEGDTSNSVAYWDGQHWAGLNFPDNGTSFPARVNQLCFYKGELYASGNFYIEVEGEWIADIVRYDGAQWHAVGGSLHGGEANIWDYAIYKDELYVCGYFRKIDGNVGNKIMRWDGQQWKEVGGGLCSPAAVAEGLAVIDDKLLIYGVFNCVGDGLPAHNIAAWDGERWCSFGNSVFDNKINRMGEYQGETYISGGFREVDGQPCKYFAKWVGSHATDTCSAAVSATSVLQSDKEALRVVPNPANDEITLTLPAFYTGDLHIQITDALGRVLLTKDASLNNHTVKMGIEDLPAGMFFVRGFWEGKVTSGTFVKE